MDRLKDKVRFMIDKIPDFLRVQLFKLQLEDKYVNEVKNEAPLLPRENISWRRGVALCGVPAREHGYSFRREDRDRPTRDGRADY